MSDEGVFGRPDPTSLAGLIFELASQLHVERTRRMALETALSRANILSVTQIEGLSGDENFIAQSRAELDKSMKALMKIILESPDQRTPLRHEKRVRPVED